ncbi:hypothetical protein HY546_03240 [archaeon]|nr:hypothetical protein [archaeon]
MEGVPFRLLISLLIAAAVVSTAFYVISIMRDTTARKQFADDIINFKESIDSLVAIGDYGSFREVRLRIPATNWVTLNTSTNMLQVNFFTEIKEYSLDAQIVWERQYAEGDYNIELFYGDPASFNMMARQNEQLFAAFK